MKSCAGVLHGISNSLSTALSVAVIAISAKIQDSCPRKRGEIQSSGNGVYQALGPFGLVGSFLLTAAKPVQGVFSTPTNG
jgi:hypothetical protein